MKPSEAEIGKVYLFRYASGSTTRETTGRLLSRSPHTRGQELFVFQQKRTGLGMLPTGMILEMEEA